MKTIKIILLIILTPYIGVKFYSKITKEEENLLRLHNDLQLHEKEQLFMLVYNKRTNRDLLTDCLYSFIFFSSLISIILLLTINPILIFKH